MAPREPYPCTAALRTKRPLPRGAPVGEPYLLCSVIERDGSPVALTMTFEHNCPDPSIPEGEVVAYTDGKGRLLELATTRGIEAPQHLILQAEAQGKWIELQVPVKVVAWYRPKGIN